MVLHCLRTMFFPYMPCFTQIVDWEVQETKTGEHHDYANDSELPHDGDENQIVENLGLVSTHL